MTDTVIRVENLGKRYRIGLKEKISKSLGGQAKDLLTSPFKYLNSVMREPSPDEVFWALKDVSFEVKRGDVLGVIGRNGSGKSTLLKILSRITEPTKGFVEIRGRVGSLLEVGTGFHPDLTGRENTYLNGTIMGMKKREIDRRFDEIVDFAEVEKFIDTPVKHYSSGMYTRLAFAVAAHLEPEILILDEVLAVGDTQFQKKCLGKMEDVSKEGRTVLFVSHSMSTVQKLCSSALYLQLGKIQVQGATEEVIEKYLIESKKDLKPVSLKDRQDRQGTGKVRINNFFIINKLGETQEILKSGEDYIFVVEIEKDDMTRNLDNVICSIDILDNKDNTIFMTRTNFTNQNFSLHKTLSRVECEIKDFSLTTGSYNLRLFLSHREIEVLDFIENVTELIVEGGDFFGTGSAGMPSHCKVLTHASWRLI